MILLVFSFNIDVSVDNIDYEDIYDNNDYEDIYDNNDYEYPYNHVNRNDKLK